MNKQKVASGSLAVGRWLLRWTGTPGTGFAVGNNPVAAALPNEPLLTYLVPTYYLPATYLVLSPTCYLPVTIFMIFANILWPMPCQTSHYLPTTTSHLLPTWYYYYYLLFASDYFFLF